jgi:8-oxo-dGTP pyrophosphatase MutT (NUDIX family)
MSAGVILVDVLGRVLMQLRDDDPSIMFPGHWGLTGGASLEGESPEETARREVREETGIDLPRFTAFRAYYFTENGTGKKKPTARGDYELYLFHAPCGTPVEDMTCGEGRELRFFGPADLGGLDIAYNHREVLDDFFASSHYARYLDDSAFDGASDHVDPAAQFAADVESGAPWFEAMMQAIALWERPVEDVDGRVYRYLLAGEAFDWLLLAERLAESAASALPAAELQRLLFEGIPPGAASAIDDGRLRALIGDAKHRAHLNYVYGVTVEEALQYCAELELSKERSNVALRDFRDEDAPVDPVYDRIYGRARHELLTEFRASRAAPGRTAPMSEVIPLSEMREFLYWLFKYRVANQEPARVASDTRKALAQLSSIEAAARLRRARAAVAAPPEEVAVS